MKHLVLQHPYDPENQFPAWKLVSFSKSSKNIKTPFKLGDVFVTIAAEHVSDVIPNIAAFSIAVSDKKLTSIQKYPYTVSSCLNWYQLYDTYTANGIFGFSASRLTGRSAVVVAYAWARYAAQQLPIANPILFQALQTIGVWLAKGKNLGEDLRDIYSLNELMEASVGSECEYFFGKVIKTMVPMIATSTAESATFFRGDMNHLAAELSNTFYLGGISKSEGIRGIEGLKEVLLRILPMQELMLAVAEDRIIDLPNATLPR